MARKKKNQVADGEVIESTEVTTEEEVEETTTEEVVTEPELTEEEKQDRADQVIKEENAKLELPVAPVAPVSAEIAIGDEVKIKDINLPKFKDKVLTVADVNSSVVFVIVGGTKYGFKKERCIKVG